MIKFSQEKVLLLHKLITDETGGDPNIRDAAEEMHRNFFKKSFRTFKNL